MEQTGISLSVVIPVHNEGENVKALHAELVTMLRELGRGAEIIFVNDASTDATLVVLQQLTPVKVVDLATRSGQAAALGAGFEAAGGDIVVSMDGDGQSDPADVPRLLAHLESGFDVVGGWRRKRSDTRARIFVSRLGAWFQRRLLGETLHDSACTLRAHRSWVLKDLNLRQGFHRFVPTLLRARGARIGEVRVNDRPRRHGRTKYKLTKVFPGMIDLVLIWFQYRYAFQPAHFFGRLALASLVGSLVAGIAARLGGFAALPHSQLLLAIAALLCLTLALHFGGLGLIAELVTRHGRTRSPYVIRQVLERGSWAPPIEGSVPVAAEEPIDRGPKLEGASS